jgi:hypothetical protein
VLVSGRREVSLEGLRVRALGLDHLGNLKAPPATDGLDQPARVVQLDLEFGAGAVEQNCQKVDFRGLVGPSMIATTSILRLPLLAGRADAVLANCSAPEAMPVALDVLARSGVPFGAYANAFTQITKAFLESRPTSDRLHPRRDMAPEIYADHVMGWIGQGASIVGGCCETGPAHIAEIARRLREAGLHD